MDQPGYGLIETMRVREGRIPFLSRQLARLERSLNEVDLAKPAHDLAALVTPVAATGRAVLRIEDRDGHANVTVRALPPAAPAALSAAPEPHPAGRPPAPAGRFWPAA